MTAEEVVQALGLAPHPEGGWFRETFRDPSAAKDPTDGRGASTAIYYLLAGGQAPRWHRVTDAAEAWHFYAGAPLALDIAPLVGGPCARLVLGADLEAGQRPQAVVPAGDWQSAASLGAWTLVGCTVAPAFQFSSFVMAPQGWEPG